VLAAVALILVLLRWVVFRPAPVPVSVYRVNRGRVEETVVNSRAGTVESRLRSRMSPGLSGLVAEIPVKKGEAVKRGQVLLTLDAGELAPQVTLAERSLSAARAGSHEACLAAEQAERDRERSEALAAEGLLAEQAREQARTHAEQARAACEAAGERAKEAEAALNAARATLAKSVMTAPFDGIVLDVTTEVGEWITPSPPGVFIPPVIDLIDPTSLYVSAPVDEADVSRVRLALPVRITLDAFPGRSFAGVLTHVSSFVETQQEQNRTLTVEAVFTEGDLPANLLPGLSADLEIILAQRDDVLRIPTYAILEGDRVLVVRGDRLEERKITAGLKNWAFTEIAGGIQAGDRVVVSLDRPEIKAGARVTVTEEVAP
jgi:HlyD family secretion protein